MRNAGVKLVVPSPLHRKYPEEIRGELISLADFIHETKALYEVE
jgi:type II restriction enzyme